MVSSHRNDEMDARYSETDVRVITSARFRSDGSGYLEDRYKQIFLSDTITGDVQQITDGQYDHIQAAWSPNGNELAFCEQPARWLGVLQGTGSLSREDRVETDPATNGRRREAGHSHPGPQTGRTIAAYGTTELRSGSARNELFLVDLATSSVRSCTSENDLDLRDSSISDWNGYALNPPIWIDSDHVLCVAGVRGAVTPVSIDVADWLD